LQQDIAAISDAVVQKYYEDTPKTERTEEGIAAAMRTSIKDSTEKLYKKLSKITAMASPNLGPDFLKEVH
jgi:hypothetical protein